MKPLVTRSVTSKVSRFRVECTALNLLLIKVLTMRKIKTLLVGMLASLLWSIPIVQADSMPGTVASAEEAEAIYAARSDFMKGLGGSMKAFSNFLKRGDGEPLELAARAGEIAEGAADIPGLFPKDTGHAQNEESESKPDIWEDWAGFVAASEALIEPAMALEAAFDSGDKGAIGAAVKTLGGQGCKGCHDKFREKHDH